MWVRYYATNPDYITWSNSFYCNKNKRYIMRIGTAHVKIWNKMTHRYMVRTHAHILFFFFMKDSIKILIFRIFILEIKIYTPTELGVQFQNFLFWKWKSSFWLLFFTSCFKIISSSFSILNVAPFSPYSTTIINPELFTFLFSAELINNQILQHQNKNEQ